MKITIIIPTYNEKGNIEKLITLLETKVFPLVKNHTMGILVVDDTSPDGTADIVKTLMKKWKNISLLMGKKEGLGKAYLRGMHYAVDTLHAEVMFEMDADFFHDPYQIPQFITQIEKGYDFVVGTRYSEGGSIPSNWAMHRKAFSLFGNFLVRLILLRFSIHDWTGGYRAIKKEVFLKEREKIQAVTGYTFQVALLYQAVLDGFTVSEVPFHATDRTAGRSKIASFEYITNLLFYVITAKIKELKRFIKFLIVGGTGFFVQLFVQEVSIRTNLTLFLLSLVTPFFTFANLQVAANAVGVGLGAESAILSNFLFNNIWTFSNKKKRRKKHTLIKLLKFNLTSFMSILIQVSFVWIGERLLGSTLHLFSVVVPTRICILIPTIILFVIPLNYLVYNRIIWKTQKEYDA